jgi:hypothetical protein
MFGALIESVKIRERLIEKINQEKIRKSSVINLNHF